MDLKKSSREVKKDTLENAHITERFRRSYSFSITSEVLIITVKVYWE
jgi:hypothetical protein